MQNTLRFSHLAAALFASFVLVLLPHSAHAATQSISITGTAFSPQNVTIASGDSITFVNNTSTGHTVVSDNGTFTTGVVPAGGNATAIFSLPGTYGFHDVVTTSMSGTITVLGVAPVPSSGGTYVNPNANFNQNVGTPTYTGTGSASTASLYAQVQALIAQINALQGTSGTTPSTVTGGTTTYNSSSCPLIGRALSVGATGDDVTRLQQFLARDTSVYPQGTVSGFYGSLTQAAVQRWQTKFNIVSSGSPSTTGFGVVGPRTASAMSQLCTTGTYNGISAGTGTGTGSAPVGGFIQVTPISGAAPVVINVTATVNTTLSCAGAQYVLDFGDGTAVQQIPVSAGNCSQLSQTYPHTYNYGGTYNITLSAGGHTTNATVTLTGPASPAGGGGGTTPTPGQYTGTISAFTTSGNAPFNVTFYVSCAAGTAYNVVFGDGQDLGSTAVSGSKCGSGGLDAVTHTYTTSGGYTAQLIIFAQQTNGTVIPHNVGSVDINVGSVTTNYVYNPPTLSQGSSALSFTLQFDLPTACTGYDVTWGDGSSHNSQVDGGSACSQTTTLKSVSHTYATSTASYTIVLKRGVTLAKRDDVAVVFSH